jgi:DnaJ-class molecular chaperone
MTRMRGYGKGDELVKINVAVPKKLTKEQEELIRQLENVPKKGWFA